MPITNDQVKQARLWLRQPRSLLNCWRVGQLVRQTIGAVDERRSVYGEMRSIADELNLHPDVLRKFVRLGSWPAKDIRRAVTAGALTRVILASLALDHRPSAVRERRLLLQRLADKKITAAEFNLGLQNLLREARRGKPSNAAAEFSHARAYVLRRANAIITRLETAQARLMRTGTPGQRRHIGALLGLARGLK